jgi:hypothetical protein
MSSGAYALYVDAQAGGGPNPPIDRIVPLPHGSREIQFDRRRLTLSCDNPQPTALPSLVGPGRFLGRFRRQCHNQRWGMPGPRHSRGGMRSVPPC